MGIDSAINKNFKFIVLYIKIISLYVRVYDMVLSDVVYIKYPKVKQQH